MKPLVIIGDGGHARVLLSMAALLGRSVSGVTSLHRSPSTLWGTVPVLGNDEVIADLDPAEIHLVNGIGSVNVSESRADIYDRFVGLGYTFASLVHPSSVVSEEATIKAGAQVMAGSIIIAGAVVGENALVNTGAILDHDSHLGNHAHLAPGAVCSGGVRIGRSCHVGTGATLIQGIELGERVLVAAGAVVTTDVASGQRVKGVPASAF